MRINGELGAGIGWSAATLLTGKGLPVAHQEAVLEERAVSIVLNGQAYAVMMVTPEHLDDFFMGFLWSEAIIHDPEEIITWEWVTENGAWAVYLQLTAAAAERAQHKRRQVLGGSACGLCGTPLLAGLIPFAPLESSFCCSPVSIRTLMLQMQEQQALNHSTGTAHAAILGYRRDYLVREDIGRHNAVDKGIGAAIQQGLMPGEVNVLGISSRLSFEIVLKAIGFGIPVIAAISGVSSLAIELAESHGVTLIGYARDDRMTLYAHSERIQKDWMPALSLLCD